MSSAAGPNIPTSGLALSVDMTNTSKSWRGQPTINQFGIPTPDVNGYVTFPVQGTAGFQRIYSGTYGGYEIQPSDIVYKYVLGLGPTACHYHGNTISVTAGQTPTWSFDYYIDPSTTGYPVTNYLANMESTIGVGAALTDPTPGIIGVWKRATQTSAAATANGTFNAYLYPGACGTQMATGGFILYKNPQVELNSFATPFVAGTRSTTDNLIDLTRNSTVTTGGLTYNSDNTFNFTYSSASYISVPLATAFNKLEGTINLWLYPTRYNGGNGYFVNRDSTTENAVDWLWIGPYSDTFYFRLGDGTTCCNNDLTIASYSTVAPLNTWVNMCFTWKSGVTSNIYKNGTLIATRAISAIPATSPTATGRFGFGHGNLDNYYDGKMPIIQIYNRQLTAAEVQSNFNALRQRYGL